jgi:hypothetical protein
MPPPGEGPRPPGGGPRPMPPPGPRPPRIEDDNQSWADEEDDDAGAGPRNPVRFYTGRVPRSQAANRGRGRRRGENQEIALTGGPGQPPQPPTHGQVLVGKRDEVAKPSDDWKPPDTGEPQIEHVEVNEEVFQTPREHSGASSSGLQGPPLPPPLTTVGSIPAGARVPEPGRVDAARSVLQPPPQSTIQPSQAPVRADRASRLSNMFRQQQEEQQQQPSGPSALRSGIINAARQ